MSFTVLVVDDATFVRDLIKRTLRQLMPQAEILEAQEGTRAQSLIRHKSVDLILSDWEMPGMSGEELLRWVRGEAKSVETPFVMITSRGDRNHVVQAVNAGVSDYLTKPFTADELSRKLMKQFKRLGVQPNPRNQAQSGGSPFDTVSVLTGGSSKPDAGGRESGKAPVQTNASGDFKGRVFLRFTNGSGECAVRDITLQALAGEISRDVGPPALFESAAVDLELENGETLARLNGYVHTLQAAQADPSCDRVKIVVRFVDKDPDKLEALSRCLTKR